MAPILFNVLRWSVALALLAPFALPHVRAHAATRKAQWYFLLVSSFLGINAYNALQYLALTTCAALNISLIGAATPVFVLICGRLFFGQRIKALSACGAVVSNMGVAWVVAREDVARLDAIHFVRGDLFMLTAALAQSVYTLLLKQPRTRVPIAALLAVQIALGLLFSVPFVVVGHLGGGHPPMAWGWRELGIDSSAMRHPRPSPFLATATPRLPTPAVHLPRRQKMSPAANSPCR